MSQEAESPSSNHDTPKSPKANGSGDQKRKFEVVGGKQGGKPTRNRIHARYEDLSSQDEEDSDDDKTEQDLEQSDDDDDEDALEEIDTSNIIHSGRTRRKVIDFKQKLAELEQEGQLQDEEDDDREYKSPEGGE